MDPGVTALIGVLVGGLITVAVEWIRGNRDRSLDSAKRADDRQIAADVFQRENLLALQEALIDFSRVLDAQLADAYGKERVTRSQKELQEFKATRRQLDLLIERVKDDELRVLVDDLRRASDDFETEFTDGVFMPGTVGSERAVVIGESIKLRVKRGRKVDARLGEVLRELL